MIGNDVSFLRPAHPATGGKWDFIVIGENEN